MLAPLWFARWANDDAIVYASDSKKFYWIPSVGGSPEPLDIDPAFVSEELSYFSDVTPGEEAVFAVTVAGAR